jgi:hypothetical protein
MTTTPTASHQGQGAAATAADEGQRLGGVAAEEAQNVASDVKEQAQKLLDDTLHQVNEQGSVQRDRLVELLRSVSRDLREMADRTDGSSLAGQLVRQGADRAEGVSSSLDGRDPSALVDDVRAFAGRKPGVFLAGALLAGVAVGRFARGAKRAQSSSDSASSDESASAQSASAQSSLGRDNPAPRPVTGPLDGPGVPVAPAAAAEAPTSSFQGAATDSPGLDDPYTGTA